MNERLSTNTQAILLLTAPLIAGRADRSPDLLSFTEYKKLARFLRDNNHEPADLLEADSGDLIASCRSIVEYSRIKRLLERGFLLSQAVDQWQSRAIWVVSRADAEYPKRLKARLREDAPPIIYGCGDASILNSGGLAVVGSRNANDALVEYTAEIGRLAASAQRTIVSGGARGIDQAAMRGALARDGQVAGVLADSLGRATIDREHRRHLMDGRLVLLSPYDPSAGFNVGHAMQRNKLIYALADAALIVSVEYEKGGTWAGAIEQLEKWHFVPLYLRADAGSVKGREALTLRGALDWPEPQSGEELSNILARQVRDPDTTVVEQMSLLPTTTAGDEAPTRAVASEVLGPSKAIDRDHATPAEELFATVRDILARLEPPKTYAEVAAELNVSRPQAKQWLERLVEEGLLDKLSRPIRYRSLASSGRLL